MKRSSDVLSRFEFHAFKPEASDSRFIIRLSIFCTEKSCNWTGDIDVSKDNLAQVLRKAHSHIPCKHSKEERSRIARNEMPWMQESPT